MSRADNGRAFSGVTSKLARLGLVLALALPSVATIAQPPNEPAPVAPAPNEPTPDPVAPAPTPNEPTPDPVAPAPTPNEPTEPSDVAPTSPPSEPPDSPPPSTLPDGHQPVIQVELTPNDGLMTGDVLTLTLRVTTPARDDVTIPRGQRFAPFEVLRRPTPRVEVRGDEATHVIEIELLALEPGDHELPPVTLRVVTADGVVGEVSTAPLRVPVGSVLGNEPNAEPKPPTEPVEVWQDDYTLAWVLGGLGLVLLGALLAWLFTRWWRRRAKAAAPPPPPRPPWEVALEKLEALRLDRDAAVREERVVGWVDQVSDALREYLGRRYEFDGLESTTDEVVAELRKRKLIGLSLDEVVALLRDCDLVKFAKAPLGVEQSDLLLAGAFRVVRTTAPVGGMSAMGPVTSSAPAPTAPPAPAPTGDARWMGPSEASSVQPHGGTPPQEKAVAPAPTFDPNAPWTPPGATPPAPAKPAPVAETAWMPPGTASESKAAAPVAPAAVSPAAPASEPESSGWTPPPATAPRTLDGWAPPAPSTVEAWAPPPATSPRLDPSFEPKLDPAPSSSGDVIAPAPQKPRVIPATREVEALPADLPADFPATRPPAQPVTRPIPPTMPPPETPLHSATDPDEPMHSTTQPGHADPAAHADATGKNDPEEPS
ncbi:MAG: hypothetical protein H6721_12055 [Sandaracinus sp.]|nr:hypothetical protein [Sandaracinus sp.]MCB9615063.1 hypothetical protein [Sandaracinus sp.]MCB9621975.1 hypothetical protein [Sandaracinus sp.]MCB9632856.1 hypothetical protein [Sandaracinus sp.]